MIRHYTLNKNYNVETNFFFFFDNEELVEDTKYIAYKSNIKSKLHLKNQM